jgi:hypothetical protein
MTKHYIVSEETLRQVLDALEAEERAMDADLLPATYRAMQALRAIIAKGPVEPVGQIDEFGVFKDLTEYYLPDGTKLYAIPKEMVITQPAETKHVGYAIPDEKGTYLTTSIPSPQYMKWEPKGDEA